MSTELSFLTLARVRLAKWITLARTARSTKRAPGRKNRLKWRLSRFSLSPALSNSTRTMKVTLLAP